MRAIVRHEYGSPDVVHLQDVSQCLFGALRAP